MCKRFSRSDCDEFVISVGFIYSSGGQTYSMHEPHIIKPELQRAATQKSKNTNLFVIYASVTS